VLSNVLQGIGNFTYGIVRSPALVAENQHLKDQLAALNAYTETIDRHESEVDSLRKLHNLLQVPGKDRLLTQVVGYFPNEHRFTISAGTSSGVKIGQPVIAPEGLIGVVQTVSTKSAQAQLLTSPPPFAIGAIVAGHNPPPAGLLRGETSNTFVLQFDDPQAPVKVGDLVVTSGFSEHIPRGVPIGRVIQVVDDVEFGRRQARVYPNVSIGKVREVYVLR
jgi:rod shape-determining protein MreC